MSSNVVITVQNLTKKYRLGTTNHGTLYRDLQSWWARLRGKEDPNSILNLHGTPAKPNSSNNDEYFMALNDVSFEVQQGDLVGIIGRNGAGKSTLLKILSQVTCPTSGTVKLKGRVASLLEVGTGFHPELTGLENIFLNGAILGMSKVEIRRKLDEIIAFAEVEKFVDTPVKRYSSGMYVRLAFAVAAHLEPEILIVDEVLAVGDAQFQKKCLGKMDSFGKDGRTVIFVSHNIGAVRSLCTRALLVDQGTLITDGESNVVCPRYLSDQKFQIASRSTESASNGGLIRNSESVVTKVEICDMHHSDEPKIDTDSPFQIEINYTVLKDGASVGFNLLVHDSENNCVFGSMNNHEVSWYGRPMPTGDYRSVCHIPKHFLNNGLYRVSLVLFSRGYANLITKSDLLIVEVHDGKYVRGDYLGAFSSVTRPLFVWETVKV